MDNINELETYLLHINLGAYPELDGDIGIKKVAEGSYELMNLSTLSSKQAISLLTKALEKVREEHELNEGYMKENKMLIGEIESAILSF